MALEVVLCDDVDATVDNDDVMVDNDNAVVDDDVIVDNGDVMIDSATGHHAHIHCSLIPRPSVAIYIWMLFIVAYEGATFFCGLHCTSAYIEP